MYYVVELHLFHFVKRLKGNSYTRSFFGLPYVSLMSVRPEPVDMIIVMYCVGLCVDSMFVYTLYLNIRYFPISSVLFYRLDRPHPFFNNNVGR